MFADKTQTADSPRAPVPGESHEGTGDSRGCGWAEIGYLHP